MTVSIARPKEWKQRRKKEDKKKKKTALPPKNALKHTIFELSVHSVTLDGARVAVPLYFQALCSAKLG